MLVYKKNIEELLDKVYARFESTNGVKLGGTLKPDYFRELADDINNKLDVHLSNETLYKHYFIRLRSWDKEEVGYSVGYLNALSQYAYSCDYLDKFNRITARTEDEVEFPWNHPSFPATPAIKLNYKNFTNLWVKDEGCNPSGCHKDRKAHEIYLMYRDLITKQLNHGKMLDFPRLSIISSGFAALAIQNRLYHSGLPNLKVLVDKDIPEGIRHQLELSRAEVYTTDLKERKLKDVDILALTENDRGNGIDLVYGKEIQSIALSYYDWLSLELLNLNPNHLIIPYGSGELYRNAVELHLRELKTRQNSRRYFGNKDILRKCNFIGATAERKRLDSMLFCLVSYFESIDRESVKTLLNKENCGMDSGILEVLEEEERIRSAVDILEREIKVNTCPSGAAGFALFLQLEEEGYWNGKEDEKIVIVNTGNIKSDLFQK